MNFPVEVVQQLEMNRAHMLETHWHWLGQKFILLQLIKINHMRDAQQINHRS
jgi:hypothetical protein